MISVTGGFNQQFSGAVIKVAKERLVKDTLVLAQGSIELFSFPEHLTPIAENADNFQDEIGLFSFRENIDDITDDVNNYLETLEFYEFTENLNLLGENANNLLDAISAESTIQHFNDNYSDDANNFDELIETDLTEVP